MTQWHHSSVPSSDFFRCPWIFYPPSCWTLRLKKGLVVLAVPMNHESLVFLSPHPEINKKSVSSKMLKASMLVMANSYVKISSLKLDRATPCDGTRCQGSPVFVSWAMVWSHGLNQRVQKTLESNGGWRGEWVETKSFFERLKINLRIKGWKKMNMVPSRARQSQEKDHLVISK